jgi:transposase
LPRVGGLEGCHHGKALSREIRDDVVRVCRNRDDGVTIEQIAADFGVHPVTLSKWLRQADINEGTKPGTTTGDSADLREARRRIKLLERGAAPGRGLSGTIQSAGKKTLLWFCVKLWLADVGTLIGRRSV